MESLRAVKEGWARMAEKARVREAGEVSVGKVSMVAVGVLVLRPEWAVERVLGLRARSATARLPREGSERIRAIPVP